MDNISEPNENIKMVSIPETLFSEMMEHLPDDFETKYLRYLKSLKGDK